VREIGQAENHEYILADALGSRVCFAPQEDFFDFRRCANLARELCHEATAFFCSLWEISARRALRMEETKATARMLALPVEWDEPLSGCASTTDGLRRERE
jgi:hypothetical protein